MVLTLPVIFPIILKLGYDPIWFGIVITVLVEAAMISPPVGFNVFTIHSLFPERPMSEVFMGSMPFFFIMVLFILVLTVFPDLATWLPSTMAR
jgi:TRAP-type C4-dicarboxylate transport system permease large subunit